jgi:hypothetical protein
MLTRFSLPQCQILGIYKKRALHFAFVPESLEVGEDKTFSFKEQFRA